MLQPLNKNELRDVLYNNSGVEPTWTKDPFGNDYGWLSLSSPAPLIKIAPALFSKARLCTVTAYMEKPGDENKRRCIAYHFASGGLAFTITIPVYDQETLKPVPVPSITPWFRNADWNEREFHEMFGIEIDGHPNPNRLFLDEELDAGIMNELIPFSVMANSANTANLWEILMAEKNPDAPQAGNQSVPIAALTLEGGAMGSDISGKDKEQA